ncbi:MAG: HAMP domain-containing histidine kinase [Bacteroidetes bacterium]|nr:HAMP domain-containing histidine kinase [Bacteroidota bacterium]
MNIYSKKRKWKIILFVSAIVIVAISLFYTNTLVNKIAQEERKKVKLWADAIQKKASLVKYTNELFEKIKKEERKKVELWAKGTKMLANPALQIDDLSFIFEVIKNNETVPVILADSKGTVIATRNIDSVLQSNADYLRQEIAIMNALQPPIEIEIYKGQKNYLYYRDSRLFNDLKIVLDDLIKSFISEVAINTASVPVIYTDSTRIQVVAFGNIDSAIVSDNAELQATIKSMEAQNKPIEIELSNNERYYIFYNDSFLLTQLKYYPYFQFLIIGLFLFIAYTLFSTARKAEQNQVWVGMAKETAHQLGTPLSSLLAWVEYLKLKGLDAETIHEIQNDVSRLETITERFSKIGSTPVLDLHNLEAVLSESVDYMKKRTSKNVLFEVKNNVSYDLQVKINKPLFEWVIENLCRNAVDAMDGKGSIYIEVSDQTQFVYIDISDTGKGMPNSKYKTVFEPGYTTKQRGWGLGLSLCKRIIENYHQGKIFVRSSEIGKGTTFRIVLAK